jgi:hypothetical protein
VRVVALAFTQGINEQQSLAHRVTGEGAELQDGLNAASLRRAAAFTQQLLGASAVQRGVQAPVRAAQQQQWRRRQQQEEEGQQGGGGGGGGGEILLS